MATPARQEVGIRKLLGKWKRRLGLEPTLSVAPDLAAELQFYQFKAGTAAFFHDRLGKTSVRVRDTPHFAFAEELAGSGAVRRGEGERYYRDYLGASWGDRPTQEFDDQVAKFRKSFDFYKAQGMRERPVLTRLPTSGVPYVVDGNHRFAFASVLEMQVTATILDPAEAFRRYSRIPGFYGTGNKGMPYQSIVLSQREVVGGRRRDMAERLNMVPRDVIEHRSILDVACNVGTNSRIAHELGARSVVGLEKSKGMVDLASRFAMFSGAYPEVAFRTFDLNRDRLGNETFDTAFMFSIYDHLEEPGNLARMIADNVTQFVVFEAHPKGKPSDYPEVFGAGLFSSVTELGTLHTSRFQEDNSRTLLLCRR